MNTTKLNTTISHSIQLTTDLIRGKGADQVLMTSIKDGTRALVEYGEDGMLYSIEVRPLFVKRVVPNLEWVWQNKIEACDENECVECTSLDGTPAHINDLPENCYPAEEDCTCEDADQCPAALRKFEDYLDDWDVEHEKPANNFNEAFNSPMKQIDNLIKSVKVK